MLQNVIILNYIFSIFIFVKEAERCHNIFRLDKTDLQLIKPEHFNEEKILAMFPIDHIYKGENSKAIKNETAFEYIVVGNFVYVPHHLYCLGVLVLCKKI
jgi:hypothetical protein